MKARYRNKLLSFLEGNRMCIFLCSLIALLVIFPFMHEWYSNYLGFLEAFFTFLLITGVYAVSRDPQILTIATLVAVLASTVMWFNFVLHSDVLLVIGLVLQILFFIMTTITILFHVLSYHRVNADTIYGAISAYFLLGIIWGMIYTALELAMPESFSFSQQFSHSNVFIEGHRFYFSQFLYFSFITLTTLGYGDIVPVSLEARGFASLEAITGQLYVAVLIARLVGLHISHTHWERVKQEKTELTD